MQCDRLNKDYEPLVRNIASIQRFISENIISCIFIVIYVYITLSEPEPIRNFCLTLEIPSCRWNDGIL